MSDWNMLLLDFICRSTLLALLCVVVFILARRRGPAVASLAATSGLTLLLLMPLLLVLPWHFNVVVDTSALDRTFNPKVNTAQPDENNGTASSHSSIVVEESTNARKRGGEFTWSEVFSIWWDEIQTDTVHSGLTNQPRERLSPLVYVVLAVVLAGLGRLALACWGVIQCRRLSRPVCDGELLLMLEQLRIQLDIRRPITLHQCARIYSPATMGFLQPIILLPDDWPEWSNCERRAVLVHELAHIRRGDFLGGLIAQFCVALHGFHPLVWWLASRLRLEQELAADAWGACLAGGATRYLKSLARLALRYDERAAGGAASAFLPHRGTLLRRIAMLRDHAQIPLPVASWARRSIIVMMLVLGTTCVVGLRPTLRAETAPQDSPLAIPTVGDNQVVAFAGGQADQDAAVQQEFAFIPTNSVYLVTVRAASLLARPEMKPFIPMLTKTIPGWEDKTLEQLERFTVAFYPKDNFPASVAILQFKQPQEWRKIFPQLPWGADDYTEQNVLGLAVHRSERRRAGWFFPNARSVVICENGGLEDALLNARGASEFAWAPLWKQAGAGDIIVGVDIASLYKLYQMENLRRPQNQGPTAMRLAMLEPLWDKSNYAVVGISFKEKVQMRGWMRCQDGAAAERAAATAHALAVLGKNSLPILRGSLANSLEKNWVGCILDLADELLDNLKVTPDDQLVKVHANLKTSTQNLTSKLVPLTLQARTTAQRMHSMNNLKQLALALHNYQDVHGSFPPPVLYGPDGKTPHSWRVAILPYIEQEPMYRAYKMDEPWDGPNNRKLLAKIPAVFCCPNNPNKKLSYFALIGSTTVWPEGKTGASIADITDGTSNTIMLVEADRDIPWTKPEDIPYDAKKPLPKLGGVFAAGFHVAFCDGSVKLLAPTIAEHTLRALITARGQEVVENN